MTSVSGEHANRPALKTVLESADIILQAVNDPKRREIGMPDFVVLRQPGSIPIGIVEAKPIKDQMIRTERIAIKFSSLPDLRQSDPDQLPRIPLVCERREDSNRPHSQSEY